MEKERINQLLKSVKMRTLSIEKAIAQLKTLPFEDLEFVKIDHHRHLRTGMSEAIYCEGKTDQEVLMIIGKMIRNKSNLLATRASKSLFQKAKKKFPKIQYNERARILSYQKKKTPQKGSIVLLCAGTSDLAVAEEAALTAEHLGNRVKRIYDVGVAGLHRLLDQIPHFDGAHVLIVVAGMEGALPSVVAGLVGKPVIAVPTSVGYGANFEGITPLLAMLNSCAPGVTVVNIDNGYGAGVAAHLINQGAL